MPISRCNVRLAVQVRRRPGAIDGLTLQEKLKLKNWVTSNRWLIRARKQDQTV